VDYYDSEYRRQYCRERVAQMRDEYQRVQAPPKDSQQRQRVVMQMWSMAARMRRRAPQRAPAYRS
jgi:hypothetical protein